MVSLLCGLFILRCGSVFMFCWLHFRYKALVPRLYSLPGTSQTGFKRGPSSCFCVVKDNKTNSWTIIIWRKKFLKCYFEKLLKSKNVQLVTFIVKGYVTCEFKWNDIWTSTRDRCPNYTWQHFLLKSSLRDMLHTSWLHEFLSERNVLFRTWSGRPSYEVASNKF